MNNNIKITTNRQQLYQTTYECNTDLKNHIPTKKCGTYGQNCTHMGEFATSKCCKQCSLYLFIATVEVILKICDEKEQIGIDYLYDSDIYDIQSTLKTKNIHVKYSYIENLIKYLIQD